MTITKNVLIAALALVFTVPLGAIATECNAQDKKNREWAFHYPQQFQRGYLMTVGSDSLSSPQNINPTLASWYAGVKLPLLSTLDGRQVSKLTVYRNTCTNEAEIEAEEGAETSVPTAQFAGRKASAGRRVFSFLLKGAGYAAPFVMATALPGTGYFAGAPLGGVFLAGGNRLSGGVRQVQENSQIRPLSNSPHAWGEGRESARFDNWVRQRVRSSYQPLSQRQSR